MAKRLYEESNIQNIANAIREKNNSTDTYKVSEMATAISSITTGDDAVLEAIKITVDGVYLPEDGIDGYNRITVQTGDIPAEAFSNSIGGNDYRFYKNNWNWFMEKYSSRIKTLTVDPHMFEWNDRTTTIPITLQFNGYPCDYAFANCQGLTEINKIYINNDTAWLPHGSMSHLFDGCWHLRTLPNQLFGECCKGGVNDRSHMFGKCYSLRKLPDLTNVANRAPDEKSFYFRLACGATALDEITNLPVVSGGDNPTFSTYGIVKHCHRLKDFTFETNEDGTPKTADWNGKHFDLSHYVGWSSNTTYLTNYNANVYPKVNSLYMYNNYWDTENWYTGDSAFSRYNRDSAVRTINSLPDCSATGTNTIQFYGPAGNGVEGKAISTLTEEEIAVAVAKGWTVSLKETIYYDPNVGMCY